MPVQRITSCVCAAVLAFGGTAYAAPNAAREALASDATRAADAGAPPPTGDAAFAVFAESEVGVESNAPAAQQQSSRRKRENLFVRIIAAPFRGIAKLFGGGNGRAKAARVKVEVTPKPRPTPAPAAAQQAAPATPVMQSAQQAAPAAQNTQRAAQPVPTSAPASVAPPPAAAPQEQAASVPRVVSAPAHVPAPTPAPAAGPGRVIANDAAQPSEQQSPFMPLIVGVPRDPLSQGRALLGQGHLNEAIAELSIAAVSGPNLVEANNLLGLAYDRRGSHAQAREHYERALSVAPNDPQVLNNLGYSFYLDDRHDAALDSLKRAARLSPETANIQNNLALVYGRLRKYDEAFKHFARAGGELYARLQTGALLEFAGRDRDAIKHFEAARRLDPASTEALRRLITLYNRTGQRGKAEAAQQELDRPKTKSSSSSS